MLNLEPFLKKVLDVLEWKSATTIMARFTDETDTTNVFKIELKPIKCGRCSGSGKTLYGSLEGMAFTQSDFDEDPGFREELEDGVYDVPCPDCGGQGCVLEVELNNKDIVLILNTIKEQLQLEAEYQRERQHEMRMGY